MKDKLALPQVNKGLICPYCWKKSTRRDSMFVPFLKGKDMGFVLYCEKCQAFVPETNYGSGTSDGRMMTFEHYRLRETVVEHWRTLLNYHVLKNVQFKEEFAPKLGILKEDFNINHMTPSQLILLRKMVLDRIAKYATRGLTPRNLWVKREKGGR